MTNNDAYIQKLLEANPLREPLLRSIIRAFELPLGSYGLDAGCGIGLQALLLAEAIRSDGRVTGLDILPELLAYGENIVRQAHLSEQITFRQGDVTCLPFADNTFDWVWSADCVGYPSGELSPTLGELTRVVRPGGSIIILGWSSEQLLPGYPLLEARLNATCSGYIPFLKDKSPDLNFMQALRWFREAGLEHIKAQTFVSTVQAPLSSGERKALISLFEMLWGEPQPEVSAHDWAEYQRLCNAASRDFILDFPDYYGFFTYTLFQGQVPDRK